MSPQTVRPRHTPLLPRRPVADDRRERHQQGSPRRHWIFDAFDFTQGPDGELVPDLTNENIRGVGLGLQIARDIFAFGGGLAPLQTPNASAVPPIITPAPNSPMPALPAQPASVGGCANPQPTLAAAAAPSDDSAAAGSTSGRVKGSAKKAVAKVLGKKETSEEETATGAAAPAANVQGSWPSGISEQDQDQPSYTGQGAWPSGICEK